MAGERDDPKLEESTERWMWGGLVLMLLFVAAFPIYRIYEPSQRAQAAEELTGYLADQGAVLFESDCSSCHGIAGRGGLGPAIGSKEFLDSVDDTQIQQLISLGVPGTEMVAFSIDNGGPLTSQEIKAIATYLRSLQQDAQSKPNWRTPLADESLTGQDLFTLACQRCHGVDRTGIKGVAPDISPDSVTMEETDQWIADRIRNGKNAMPAFGGVLGPDQITLLIAYLRGVPPSEIGPITGQ